MKTQLQKHLATLAPSISIITLWEPDPASEPISKECDGFAPSEDDEWVTWQSEIRATAIVAGEEVRGSAYLGGTFERAGDAPETRNPEISGYEPQMTQEALSDLRTTLGGRGELAMECSAGIAYLAKFMADEYAAQRATA